MRNVHLFGCTKFNFLLWDSAVVPFFFSFDLSVTFLKKFCNCFFSAVFLIASFIYSFLLISLPLSAISSPISYFLNPSFLFLSFSLYSSKVEGFLLPNNLCFENHCSFLNESRRTQKKTQINHARPSYFTNFFSHPFFFSHLHYGKSKQFRLESSKTTGEKVERNPFRKNKLKSVVHFARDDKRWSNGFIFDFDDFGIENVEDKDNTQPIHRVRLYTGRLRYSSEFYENVLNMKLVRYRSHLCEISHPWSTYAGMSKYFIYPAGGGSGKKIKMKEEGNEEQEEFDETENRNVLLQLAYAYDENTINRGNSYGGLVISTENLETAENFIKSKGWNVTRNDSNFFFLKKNKFFVVYDFDNHPVIFVE